MGMELYSINMQIMEVHRVMGSYSLQINTHKEKIERLEEALNKLNITKNDFDDSKDKCLKPEFTPSVLYGSHESDLTSLREEMLKPAFTSIPTVQMTDAGDRITEQIEYHQQEIARLESSISSLETQQSNLMVRKEEVQNQA